MKLLQFIADYFKLWYSKVSSSESEQKNQKIYADAMNASLSYFRDKNDFEVDVILRNANGKWGAIEIKLGAGYINEAANNLLKFKERVDIEKCGEPSFLMVLTGADYSYKRDDGVYVVSIGNLKN